MKDKHVVVEFSCVHWPNKNMKEKLVGSRQRQQTGKQIKCKWLMGYDMLPK